MNKKRVSLSVPATIYDFGDNKPLTENKYVTSAKLKMFYIGTTADNRVFTKKFADQLLKTLPSTPVVAYYDMEDDDFVGHNWVQYVFGYVPETATIRYETIDGKEFAVTDVLLFTGREDNIGYVAERIIGQPHSLELDPNTVEYYLERDEEDKSPKITFTKGSFIGLSVLGSDERPAFPGSEFFTESDELETFVESFMEFRKELDLYLNTQDEDAPEEEEIEETEGTEEEVQESAETDDVEETFDEETTNETEVTDEVEDTVEVETEEEDEGDEEDPQPIVNLPAEEDDIDEASVETDDDVEDSSVAEPAEIIEGNDDAREETEDTEEEEKEVVDPDAAALNRAEREELNQYRREKKEALIETYTELDEETKESFRKTMDNYSYDELDKELAFTLVKKLRSEQNINYRIFNVNSQGEDPESLASLVTRYKD